MKVHGNAALGPAGRLALVEAIESGMTLRAAAAALNVAPATAHRWWHRWRVASEEDRPLGKLACATALRPHRQPRRLTAAEEEPILRARRETNLGPGRLAGICRRSRSTIWKVLARHGLSRRPRAPERPTAAMSGRGPERCCTSTSPAWRASSAPGTRSPAIRDLTGAEKRAEVGLRLPALRDRRPLSLRLRRAAPRPGRGDRGGGAWAGRRALRSARPRGPRGGDERQRLRLSQVECVPRAAAPPTAPATSSPRPTRRAGTARSSASSRP